MKSHYNIVHVGNGWQVVNIKTQESMSTHRTREEARTAKSALERAEAAQKGA